MRFVEFTYPAIARGYHGAPGKGGWRYETNHEADAVSGRTMGGVDVVGGAAVVGGIAGIGLPGEQ